MDEDAKPERHSFGSSHRGFGGVGVDFRSSRIKLGNSDQTKKIACRFYRPNTKSRSKKVRERKD